MKKEINLVYYKKSRYLYKDGSRITMSSLSPFFRSNYVVTIRDSITKEDITEEILVKIVASLIKEKGRDLKIKVVRNIIGKLLHNQNYSR